MHTQTVSFLLLNMWYLVGPIICDTMFTRGQSQLSCICSNICLLGALNICNKPCLYCVCFLGHQKFASDGPLTLQLQGLSVASFLWSQSGHIFVECACWPWFVCCACVHTHTHTHTYHFDTLYLSVQYKRRDVSVMILRLFSCPQQLSLRNTFIV